MAKHRAAVHKKKSPAALDQMPTRRRQQRHRTKVLSVQQNAVLQDAVQQPALQPTQDRVRDEDSMTPRRDPLARHVPFAPAVPEDQRAMSNSPAKPASAAKLNVVPKSCNETPEKGRPLLEVNSSTGLPPVSTISKLIGAELGDCAAPHMAGALLDLAGDLLARPSKRFRAQLVELGYALCNSPPTPERLRRLNLCEQAVELLARPAAAFGFTDRGTIAPGKRADLNLIDMEGLRLHPPTMAYDLPAGGRRRISPAD